MTVNRWYLPISPNGGGLKGIQNTITYKSLYWLRISNMCDEVSKINNTYHLIQNPIRELFCNFMDQLEFIEDRIKPIAIDLQNQLDTFKLQQLNYISSVMKNGSGNVPIIPGIGVQRLKSCWYHTAQDIKLANARILDIYNFIFNESFTLNDFGDMTKSYHKILQITTVPNNILMHLVDFAHLGDIRNSIEHPKLKNKHIVEYSDCRWDSKTGILEYPLFRIFDKNNNLLIEHDMISFWYGYIQTIVEMLEDIIYVDYLNNQHSMNFTLLNNPDYISRYQ